MPLEWKRMRETILREDQLHVIKWCWWAAQRRRDTVLAEMGWTRCEAPFPIATSKASAVSGGDEKDEWLLGHRSFL